MTSILTLLSSILLYAPGAFFFYPWKPVMQALAGDRYDVGFAFFRRDHTDPTNLALHMVALAWQLLGNFGLLAAIDASLWPGRISLPGGFLLPERPLSYVTAISWVATLIFSPAPLDCSLSSAAAIVIAFTAAPRLAPHELELGVVAAFVCTLVLFSIFAERKVHRGRRAAGLLGDLMRAGARFGLVVGVRLIARQWRGAFAADAAAINCGLAVLMALLASLPKPTVPAVLGGGLVVRAAAELTAQDALLFYGCAFTAQASQGLAHDVSRQAATLLSHEEFDDGHCRATKLGFEWAHVVYFPNLLTQAIREAWAKPIEGLKVE